MRAGVSRAATALVALLVLTLGAPAASPARAQDPDEVPGRYIVVYRDDIVAAADVTEVMDNERGIEVSHVYEYALDGFAGELTDEALAELRADPRVAEIIPDRKMYPMAQTLPKGANRIDADLNPFAGIDGVDRRVDADIAILDMGVGPHPDINVAGGFDCTGQGTTLDNGGHGTHVAGIAAALDNGIGIVGVAPGARIWSIKVLDAFDGNWSWVICGIDWVTGHADTIEVANMSLGEDLGPNNQVHDGPMRRAIQRSIAAGVTYVVAAGNGAGNAGTVIPAMYPEVITVSAIADSDGRPGGQGPATSRGGDDRFATFSSFGSVVDIAAPGADTYSLAPYGGYSTMNGTSFATPHVAGAVALYTAQFGRAGPAAIRTALLTTADPGPIPGDPDGIPEGVLNVGRFGTGEIDLSAGSGKPGETISANFSEFPASTELSLAWDGTAFGSVMTNGEGDATIALRVPALSKGSHVLSARGGTQFGATTFTIKPSLRLSPTAGPVGQRVTVALRGFSSRDRITLFWDNGAVLTTLTTVTVSSSGNVNATFVVPASTGGSHRLIADTQSGGSVRASFTVAPSMSRSPAEVAPGDDLSIAIRGFRSSENVTFSIETTSGVTSLGSATVSSRTGSRNVTFEVPVTLAPGAATLRAEGSRGTSIFSPLTIEAPPASAEETETPSPEVPEPSTPAAGSSPQGEASTPEATAEPTTPEPDVTVEPVTTPTPAAAVAYEVRRVSRSAGSESGLLVVDGDLTTGWSSPIRSGRSPYVQLDLGDVKPIGEIRVFALDGLPVVEVQVSSDRRTWTSVAMVEMPAGEWTVITAVVDARYIRVVVPDGEAGGVTGRIGEIEAWPPGQ